MEALRSVGGLAPHLADDLLITLRYQLSGWRGVYVPKVLAIGTNTDPYQPLEKKMRIMRGILEVLYEFRHPVGIVTKSALVCYELA